jgi:hypothetical protein
MDENECTPCVARAKAARRALAWVFIGSCVYLGWTLAGR